jgi:hypothetical protein
MKAFMKTFIPVFVAILAGGLFIGFVREVHQSWSVKVMLAKEDAKWSADSPLGLAARQALVRLLENKPFYLPVTPGEWQLINDTKKEIADGEATVRAYDEAKARADNEAKARELQSTMHTSPVWDEIRRQQALEKNPRAGPLGTPGNP